MDPNRSPILKYFTAETSGPPIAQELNFSFGTFAEALEDTLPAGPEKSTALRKLLEAKDAAVRASLNLD